MHRLRHATLGLLAGLACCTAGGLSSHPGESSSGAGRGSSGPASTSGAQGSSTAGTSSGGTSTGTASTGGDTTSGTSTGSGTSGQAPTTTAGGSTGAGEGNASGGSTGGSSTGPADAGDWAVSRVLATDGPDVEVWDLTVPAQAAPIIGPASITGGCAPRSVAMADDQEILVATQCAVDVFNPDATHAGGVNVALMDPSLDPVNSLVFVASDAGPPTVVLCGGGGLEGFAYPGAAAFDGGLLTLPVLWSNATFGVGAAGSIGNFIGTFDQCAVGPSGTLFAAYGVNGLASFDSSGHPLYAGSTAPGWPGSVSGVAVGPGGETLLVGEDDGGNGFAALFAASGECLVARTGGACAQTCDACYASDATLGQTPLDQAASLGDGTFIATILNQNAALAQSNQIVRLDGRHQLAPTDYYQGVGVFSGGPQFIGVLAWPQGP